MPLMKTVLYVSGIINKQAVFYKRLNDYDLYFLKEDLTTYEVKDDLTDLPRSLNLFFEDNGHLFQMGLLSVEGKLMALTRDDIVRMLREAFDNSINGTRKISKGLAQYYGKMAEFEESVKREEDKRLADQVERQKKKEELEARESAKDYGESLFSYGGVLTSQTHRHMALKPYFEKAGVNFYLATLIVQEKVEKTNKMHVCDMDKLKQGDWISGGEFVFLCDVFGVEIPLRTRGWALNKLTSINPSSYRASTKSTVIFDYMEKLMEYVHKYY